MIKYRIAVAGAGPAGIYVFERLRRKYNFEVEIFDIRRASLGCRCAWGVEWSAFEYYAGRLGIDADKYLLSVIDTVNFHDLTFPCKNLSVIDKPKFIKDVVGNHLRLDNNIKIQDYDLVVDATGRERAYLGDVSEENKKKVLMIDTEQTRIGEKTPKSASAKIEFIDIGYRWEFPLGEKGKHIGYGEMRSEVPDGILGKEKGCACFERIRLGPPLYNRPFSRKEGGTWIFGVGEAIGAVSPFTGEGIIPSLETAETFCTLASSGLIPGIPGEYYEKEILRQSEWMVTEWKAIRSMLSSNPFKKILLPFYVAKAAKVGAKKTGIDINGQGFKFLTRILTRRRRFKKCYPE